MSGREDTSDSLREQNRIVQTVYFRVLYYIRKLGKSGLEVKKNKLWENDTQSSVSDRSNTTESRKLSSVLSIEPLLPLERFPYAYQFHNYLSV